MNPTGWKEYFVYNFEDTSLSAGDGTSFESSSIRFDSDADFLAMKLHHIALDSQIYVKMQDDAFGRGYQNAAVDLRALSGTRLFTSGVVDVGIHPNCFLPMIMQTPILIRAGTSFACEFADASGAANSIYLSMHGAKIRVGEAPWRQEWAAKTPFWYTGSVSLSAGNAGSFSISVSIESHFLVTKITGTRTGAATINIIDNSTDRAWMDRPAHIDNIVGNSQYPNILPAPRFLRRGAVLNVQVQDLSNATNDVEIVLHGMKLH